MYEWIFGLITLHLLGFYAAFSLKKEHQLLILVMLTVGMSSLVTLPFFASKILEYEKSALTDPAQISLYQNMLDVINAIYIIGIAIFSLFLFYVAFILYLTITQIGIDGLTAIRKME